MKIHEKKKLKYLFKFVSEPSHAHKAKASK